MSVFKRSRKSTVNIAVSNLPPNRRVSVSGILRRVGQETPNRKTLAAPEGRGSRPRVLDNCFGSVAANDPLTTVVHGDSAHSGSCDRVGGLVHPKRTSCPKCIHCSNFGSCHNDNRFSNQVATPLMFTNTVTGRLLRGRNVAVNNRIGDITGVRSSDFLGARIAPRVLGDFTNGRLPLLGRSLRRRVHGLVHRTGTDNSSINNATRVYMLNVPTKINGPFFSSIRSILTRVLFSIPTVGKLRFKDNFNVTRVLKSRTGSSCCCSNSRVGAHAGRGNNVLKNVASNVPVVCGITVGPPTSVAGIRRAVGVRSGATTRLSIRNERSPVVMPHTVPMLRTIATVTVLSLLLSSGFCGCS